MLQFDVPGAVTWTAIGGGTWTNPDQINWNNNYSNGFPATFGVDSPTGVITLSGTIEPSEVIVSSANDFTFQGDALGGIDTTLTKSGTGTLTLSVANTYTGATTVSGGVLAISDADSLGAEAAGTTVTSGAQLAIDGGITVAEPLTIAS